MYIRVKRRERELSTSLYYYLAENVRGPDGPRETILGYLGGIKEEKLDDFDATEAFCRQCLKALVWNRATWHIDDETYARLLSLLANAMEFSGEYVEILRKEVEEEEAPLLAMRERILNEP